MQQIIGTVNGWLKDIVGLMMTLIAVSVVIEILFGGSFFGSTSVVTNLTNLVAQFGTGFTGLLALLILLYFWKK
ncbi:MAG: hypothetical protein QF492_06395 [Candidatus Krumholzibacteria bacterium]|jgi:hypothetical protein|nr:hypothetical protein [Candidatus Krumholzibacteria bacterium]MDP6669514.1 hypothetical protein [Candidatus Krumholzibacteria bacterium]MDP6797836.1 hypothetical protein [Candidatus Krumholzibacteria bacterium]MDP7022514.1 hypothetical protein [Candidatus Krumholzibacteria bacterium]